LCNPIGAVILGQSLIEAMIAQANIVSTRPVGRDGVVGAARHDVCAITNRATRDQLLEAHSKDWLKNLPRRARGNSDESS